MQTRRTSVRITHSAWRRKSFFIWYIYWFSFVQRCSKVNPLHARLWARSEKQMNSRATKLHRITNLRHTTSSRMRTPSCKLDYRLSTRTAARWTVTCCFHLDTVMAIVEQLTTTNAAQDRVDAVVDHVVSADRRQRWSLQFNAFISPLRSGEGLSTVFFFFYIGNNAPGSVVVIASKLLQQKEWPMGRWSHCCCLKFKRELAGRRWTAQHRSTCCWRLLKEKRCVTGLNHECARRGHGTDCVEIWRASQGHQHYIRSAVFCVCLTKNKRFARIKTPAFRRNNATDVILNWSRAHSGTQPQICHCHVPAPSKCISWVWQCLLWLADRHPLAAPLCNVQKCTTHARLTER